MSGAVATEPRLIHALPGRVRVHLTGWAERDQRALALRLSRAPGVRSVRVNSLTSNALVVFDPLMTNAATILATMRPSADGVVRTLEATRAGINAARITSLPSPVDAPDTLPPGNADQAGCLLWPPLPSSIAVHSQPPDIARLLDDVSGPLAVGACLVNLLLSSSVFGLIVNGLELLRLASELLARWDKRRRAVEASGAGARYVVMVGGL